MALAMERMFKGRANRLWQAAGPFIINYKRSDDKTKPLTTYMQIDGEFFHVISPKRVVVSRSQEIPKIKVLLNSKSKK